MHNAADLQDQLAAAGAEQYRQTYRRHGVLGDLYGVSYATLTALAKRIKTDHALANSLWESGNHDARVLATMIADADRMTLRELVRWSKDLDNPVLCDAYGGLAARTPHARTLFDRWAGSPSEWQGACAWSLVAGLARTDPAMPDEFFLTQLDVIEREIHDRENRVRYAMNGAVIGIGSRNAALRRAATAAARRIGTVRVDHGDTGCTTPDAVPYIDKIWSRKAARKT
jgi:3-methyladenine DNA glycosylase AlkD